MIVRSVRGGHYYSNDFLDAMRAYGMRSSVNRKADSWDKAPTKSLWGWLKRDRKQGNRFATRQVAQSEVMDWLAFYSTTRQHRRWVM